MGKGRPCFDFGTNRKDGTFAQSKKCYNLVLTFKFWIQCYVESRTTVPHYCQSDVSFQNREEVNIPNFIPRCHGRA